MAVGLVLTFIFMAIYYRAFGWIANLVLLANVVLSVGLMSLLQASLSLPGIAGVVFHLGMAADANVLIYERIREELRTGNSPLAVDQRGLRQGVRDDRRLERHDADRRHRAVRVRHRHDPQLRHRR